MTNVAFKGKTLLHHRFHERRDPAAEMPVAGKKLFSMR